MKIVFRVLVGLLAAVGVLVIAAGLFLRSLWNEPTKVEPIKAEKVVDSAGCACSAGAWCTGPQGGIYCLKDDGQKKYKPKG